MLVSFQSGLEVSPHELACLLVGLEQLLSELPQFDVGVFGRRLAKRPQKSFASSRGLRDARRLVS